MLSSELSPLHAALIAHPVYRTLDSVAGLRRFMEVHVFAVWDFMSLLKTLQRRLTCVEVPWTPCADREAVRLINEIVLGEESDEVSPGVYASHFDVYVEAMREVGADTRPILRFVELVRSGVAVAEALAYAPNPSRAFVLATMALCESDTPSVAAAFVYGREHLVPAMFESALATLGDAAPKLRWYLERHVEIDSADHGPKAHRLLAAVCGGDPDRIATARAAAVAALEARRQLWDALA
jgi:hypothetical protein